MCSDRRPKPSRASLLDILDDDDSGAVPRTSTAAAAAISIADSVPIFSCRATPFGKAVGSVVSATSQQASASVCPLITSVSEFYEQVCALSLLRFLDAVFVLMW